MMHHRNRKRSLFLASKVRYLYCLLVLVGSHMRFVEAAAPIAKPLDIFQKASGSFPSNCGEVNIGMSGLCVIASTSPRPTNSFLVLKKGQGGMNVSPPIKVTLNRLMQLDPGEYIVYSESGLDAQHEYKVRLTSGMVSVVTTGTVIFRAGGKSDRLQHYQDVGYGGGCNSLIVSNDVLALLPGNYQVNVVDKDATSGSNCTNSGVTFNLLEKRVLSSAIQNVRENHLPKSNRYQHPNGISSLGNISQFRADINALGLLPKWRSFRGINNPHRVSYHALVLEGIGNHRFLVPFELIGKKSDCGLSIAEAGMPAKTLLSGCIFHGNRLTDFTVEPGNYYMFNNRHGKNAIEANYINNPISVNNVRFVTK